MDGAAREKQVVRCCRELLGELSEQWQTIDLDSMGRTKAALLLMATATGLVECRLRCRAWTDNAAVEADVVVIGLWLDLEGNSVLSEQCRRAIPAWANKRIAVQVEPKIEARLTCDGGEAQANLNSPMDLAWMVMAYLVSQPRPARVKLRLTGETSAPGVAQAPPDADRTVPPSVLAELAEAVRQIRDDVSGIRQGMQTPQSAIDHRSEASPEDGAFGGPQSDPYDTRTASWMGKRIYLGNDTHVSRLFWLLASPPGRARSLAEVQQTIDGMAISESAGCSDEDVGKALLRVRKAISNLRKQLVESGLDSHVLITKGGTQKEPEYTMVSRFGA